MLSEENLYHFTSFESAVKILASGELLLGTYENFNDINEKYGPTVLAKEKDWGKIEALLKCWVALSFSMDVRTSGSVKRGYNNPVMWGSYAKAGKGVCLAFDKSKMLSVIASDNHFYSREVEYFDDVDPNFFVYDSNRYGTAEAFINANKDEIFFHKKKEWEHENEFRVIAISDEHPSLKIKDCLSGVILFYRDHKSFRESAEVKALSKFVGRRMVYRYTSAIDRFSLYDFYGRKLEPEDLYYDFSAVASPNISDQESEPD